jgi:hypothetical protein
VLKQTFLILNLLILIQFIACGGKGTQGGSGGNVGGGVNTPPGDTGTAATSLVENPLSSVCQTKDGTLYLASSGGKILFSKDSGTTINVLDGTARDIRGAFCERSSLTVTQVWFVGTAGAIYKYDGTTLSQQTSGTTKNLLAVFGANANTVIAVGEDGTALALNGSTWTSQPPSGVSDDLFGVSASDATHFYVVGANRKILKLTPPSLWSTVSDSALPSTSDVPTDTTLYAVWADPTTSEVFAVGSAGTILKATAFGATWTKQTSNTSQDLLGLYGSSTTNLVAVGKGGTLLTYNGTSWSKATVPSGTSSFTLYGAFVGSQTSAFAVGSDGATSTSTGILLGLVTGAWAKIL